MEVFLAGGMFVLTPIEGKGTGPGRTAALQRGCPWLQPELPVVGRSRGCLGPPAWSSSAGRLVAGPCSQVLSQSISAWVKQKTRWETLKEIVGPVLHWAAFAQVWQWQVAVAAWSRLRFFLRGAQQWTWSISFPLCSLNPLHNWGSNHQRVRLVLQCSCSTYQSFDLSQNQGKSVGFGSSSTTEQQH